MDWSIWQRSQKEQMLYLRKYEIGYVSQFLNVMPRTTCRQLVINALLEMGESEEVALIEAEKALTHFELDPKLWDSYPEYIFWWRKITLEYCDGNCEKTKILITR